MRHAVLFVVLVSLGCTHAAKEAAPSPKPSVAGVVVFRSGGAPAAGATVDAIPARRRTGGRASSQTTAAPIATTTTGADGAFALHGVEGGVFLRVVLRGFAPEFRQIDAPSETSQQFSLVEGATLRGRVVDASGKPIAGAELRAVTTTYATDAEGRFVVADLSPDEKPELVVRARGYAAKPVETDWPPSAAEIAIVLDRQHVVDVLVVDDEGAPLQGVRLLGRLPHAEAYSELERADFEAVTNSDGLARLEGLPPGAPVVVQAAAEGRPRVQSDVALPIDPAATPQADSRSALRITASLGRKIELRVHDADGAPVADALVRVTNPVSSRLDFRGFVARESADEGLPRETRTTADGSVVVAKLPASLLRVEIFAPGFLPRALAIEPSATDEIPVVALTKDPSPPPASVPWRASIEDAFREMDATGRPLLLSVAMDGETANDALAVRHYRDPDVVRVLSRCVPVIGSAFGGVYADPNDPKAHREVDGVCSRYGSCSCASHQATERWAVDALFGGERTFAVPRHVVITRAFELIENRGYYLSENDLVRLAVRALRRVAPSEATALATERMPEAAEALRSGDDDAVRKLARLGNAGDEYAIALLAGIVGFDAAFERGLSRETVIGAPTLDASAAAPRPTREELLATARGEDAIAAVAALRALRRDAEGEISDDEEVFDAFLARRNDPSGLVREEAVAGLASCSETPNDILRAATADSIFEVRVVAAAGLLMRGEDSGRDILEAAVNHVQYGPLARAALEVAK